MAEDDSKVEELNPRSANDITDVNMELKVWYAATKDAGYPIPISNIQSINIFESMFTKLPSMILVLQDSGSWFHYNGIQIGVKIHVLFRPNITDDKIVESYLSMDFVVQSVTYSVDHEHGGYYTLINCMYPAESYVNEICQWPNNDIVTDIKNPLQYKYYTSDEVLRQLFNTPGLGLHFSKNTAKTFDDNMLWLNTNLTYVKFIDKIVNHAWVDEDDCPLLYVNRSGDATYTTIQTLCDKTNISKAKYIHTSRYAAADMTDADKNFYVRMYSNVSLSNLGFNQNNGAYNSKAYVYNPYNLSELNANDIKINTDMLTAGGQLFFRQRNYTGIDKPLISKLGNKSSNSYTNTRYKTSNMWFDHMHPFYDYAYIHNKGFKTSFFQQFVTLTCPIMQQMIRDTEKSQRLQIGDKITIEFDSNYINQSIYNGDYIVTNITYSWNCGSTLTYAITCVSDGLNDIGDVKPLSMTNKYIN